MFVLIAAAAVQCAGQAPRLVTIKAPGSPLVAVIAPEKGGELVGLALREKGNARQLLYRGLDFCPASGWDGKAPILWPATGRTFLPGATGEAAHGWTWHGTRYSMPIHGFARDLPWHFDGITRHGGTVTASETLTDSAATRADYPFGFTFRTDYVLSGTTLTIRQHVTAAAHNAGPMPFSIGNHMTFAVPTSGAPATITTPATRRIELDDSGKPTGAATSIAPLASMSVSQFNGAGATSLGGYKAGAVTARVEWPDGLAVTLSQDASAAPSGDPVRFNLWGNAAQGYFAPEPWLGKQNALTTGDGLIRLAPGASFDWSIAVTVE